MIKYLLLIALVFFHSGCKSLETVNQPVRIDTEIRLTSSIDDYLANNQPFAAYQFFMNKINKVELEDEQTASEFKDKIFESIIESYNKAIEDKDYISAIRIIDSLFLLDRLYILNKSETRSDLMLQYINKLYDEDNITISLFYFLQYMKTETPDKDKFIRFADAAVSLNNDYALNEIITEISNNQILVDEKYIEKLNFKEHISDMMRGTVTIWVDKGIRIESGVGFPDRVIGSGFFIDKRGYLITNYHVIESEVNPEYRGYSRLYIRLPDATGTRVPARVVGWDPVFDVALLKTEIIPEYVFSFSENDNLRVGDRIYAIGSPGGLENTITSGIISSRSRKFLQIGDAMQVDVPINPGNSGGPLLNENNELIAVVFAGIEQFEGVNFAIPSRWILDILPELYTGGELRHSWIGAALHEKNNVVEIMYTVPGESADIAGLRNGDIIKSINSISCFSIVQAQKILLPLNPDSIITIDYTRDGIEKKTVLALGSRQEKSFDLAIRRDSMRNAILPLFGMEITKTGSSLFRESYLVTKVYEGSIADQTGLSVNDPLTIRSWRYDLKKRFVLLRLDVKRRKAGFMPSNLQLITTIDKTSIL